MSELFLDQASAVLTKVLDGTAVRQRALANNIANAETPGYQRQEVDFSTRLQEIVNRADADPHSAIADIQQLAVQPGDDENAVPRADGNTVQIDREMVELARNALEYETSAQLLTMKYRALNSAIHEGRR